MPLTLFLIVVTEQTGHGHTKNRGCGFNTRDGGWTWAMLAIALSPFASQGMAECSGLGELGFGLPRSIFNVEHGVHGGHHLNG